MINDSFGFDAGEEVIMGVGERLARTLRGSDIIGRTAGNKFGVILKNCREKEIAVVAARLRAAVRGSGIETRAGMVAATCQRGRGVAAAGRLHQPGSHAARRTGAGQGARQWPRRLCRLSAFAPARDRAPAPDGDRRRGGAGAEGQPPQAGLSSPSSAPSSRKVSHYECLLRMAEPDGTDPDRRPFRARLPSRWASCIWWTVSRWKPPSPS